MDLDSRRPCIQHLASRVASIPEEISSLEDNYRACIMICTSQCALDASCRGAGEMAEEGVWWQLKQQADRLVLYTILMMNL